MEAFVELNNSGAEPDTPKAVIRIKAYLRAVKKELARNLDDSVEFINLLYDAQSNRLAFDETRDQYLWFRFGWDDKKQIQYIIIYLCIKNGKVWVEEDATNLCIVDDLLSAGIPQADIVLGFHHPSKRGFTEFATA
ncbi:XisI protein [Nostoc sp.]